MLVSKENLCSKHIDARLVLGRSIRRGEMAKRKFSILIPTRSRASYLEHAIRSAVRSGERSGCAFEVIVSDNASDDRTVMLAQQDWSPSVRWLRSEQRLSMRANFQRALDAATGSHVCIIGDDDGMNLEGLRYLDRLLEATDALVVQWPQVNYTWPPSHGGTLKIRYSDTTGFYSAIDTDRTVDAIRRADFFDYHVGGNIYHGCVATSLIQTTTSSDGAPFFHAVVPDVYAAMQSLFFARGRMVRARFPVSLGGASPRSNGADSQRQSSAQGSGEFSKFITEALADGISSGLPADCRSISMITLDAFLHVCRRHGKSDAIDAQAWWKRIKPEIAAQDPADIDRHMEFARGLLGAATVEPGVTPAGRATLPPASGPEPARPQPARKKVKLTSIAVAGGSRMADLTAATEFLDRVVVGEGAIRPTTSSVAHGLRCLGTLGRAAAEDAR